MDVETFVELYRPLIVIAFIVSLINWLGYTILARWYRTPMGRIVWTKFLANVLILFTPFMQVMFSGFPFRYEFSIGSLAFFIFAITIVGVGIYKTQLKGYIKDRKKKRLERQNI